MTQGFSKIDGGLVYNDGDDFIINTYSVNEIFAHLGSRPFAIFAGSDTGKTVLAIDIVRECIKNGYNNIVYITGNPNGKGNDLLRTHVLKKQIFCPENDEQLVEFLWKLNTELIAQKTVDMKLLMSVCDGFCDESEKGNVEIFKERAFQRVKLENDYKPMMKTIYNGDIKAENTFEKLFAFGGFNDFYEYLQKPAKQELIALIKDEEMIVGDTNQQAGVIIRDWFVKLEQAFDIYEEGLEEQYKMIIKSEFNRLIVHERNRVITYFKNIELYKKNIAGKDIDTHVRDICELAQDQMKMCVIMDDLTDFFTSIEKNQNKCFFGMEELKISTAFEFVITSFATKGRHMGTFYMAMHGPKTISGGLKNHLGNFILSPNSYVAFCAERSSVNVPLVDMEFMKTLMEELGKWNADKKTFYLLIYFSDPKESPDGKKFSFIHATEHKSVDFYYEDYEVNKYFSLLAKREAGILPIEEAFQERPVEELK